MGLLILLPFQLEKKEVPINFNTASNIVIESIKPLHKKKKKLNKTHTFF